MNHTQHIWLDGKLIPADQAHTNIATHTLHYGSGAFEGIRCYETDNRPAIFRLQDHVARLLRSFACFSVHCPFDMHEIHEAIIDTVRTNKASNCYIRPIIFFGSESLALSPDTLSVHCAITTCTLHLGLPTQTMRLAIIRRRRINGDALPLHSKLNGMYINSVLAQNDAHNEGFDDALMLDSSGAIAEASCANIFFVIDGVLVTPTDYAILPGITRSSVLTIATTLGIPTAQAVVLPTEIHQASEAFICGTAIEIRPIASIGQVILPNSPGKITQRIQHAYKMATTQTTSAWNSWLTQI